MEASVERLLMELQYRFPISPTPYDEVAERLGVPVERVLETVRRLAGEGIVKRVGFYLNVRATGVRPVLVALKPRSLEAVAEAVRGDPRVTHAYLRDHPRLPVWIVVRVRSDRELEEFVAGLEPLEYAAFPSRRTLKLSVKYDLEAGVSRAGPYSRVPENPPPPEAFGVPREAARRLARLPIERRPYDAVAEELGVGVDELLARVRAMLEAGTLLDPGAALDGERLGFTHNAMGVVDGCEACECIASQPYTTHVVEREVYPEEARREWGDRLCYFMVHARSRALAERVAREVAEACGARLRLLLFSQGNLKPGVAR